MKTPAAPPTASAPASASPAVRVGVPPVPAEETVRRFRAALADGEPWPDALLEAVGEWSAPSETVDGVRLDYLIGGEAFDWLLLAERLLRTAPEGRIPADEIERLLFTGALPDGVSESAFAEALGSEKHRAHLNYFYGVVVEEALRLAVEREVEKERNLRGLRHSSGVDDAVAERLYGEGLPSLLRRFQREHGRPRRVRLTLGQSREFTYWLFKRRLAASDQARAASDMRKGLQTLTALRERADGA